MRQYSIASVTSEKFRDQLAGSLRVLKMIEQDEQRRKQEDIAWRQRAAQFSNPRRNS